MGGILVSRFSVLGSRFRVRCWVRGAVLGTMVLRAWCPVRRTRTQHLAPSHLERHLAPSTAPGTENQETRIPPMDQGGKREGEPLVGFEPTTARLRIESSTPELQWRETRMPWLGFEPRRLSALPPQDSVSTNFTTRAGASENLSAYRLSRQLGATGNGRRAAGSAPLRLEESNARNPRFVICS